MTAPDPHDIAVLYGVRCSDIGVPCDYPECGPRRVAFNRRIRRQVWRARTHLTRSWRAVYAVKR